MRRAKAPYQPDKQQNISRERKEKKKRKREEGWPSPPASQSVPFPVSLMQRSSQMVHCLSFAVSCSSLASSPFSLCFTTTSTPAHPLVPCPLRSTTSLKCTTKADWMEFCNSHQRWIQQRWACGGCFRLALLNGFCLVLPLFPFTNFDNATDAQDKEQCFLIVRLIAINRPYRYLALD